MLKSVITKQMKILVNDSTQRKDKPNRFLRLRTPKLEGIFHFFSATFYQTQCSRAVKKTSITDWFSHRSFASKSSKHHNSQTIRARDLTFLYNVHHVSRVMCHISPITCQMSGVFFKPFLELLGLGSVINGAYPI